MTVTEGGKICEDETRISHSTEEGMLSAADVNGDPATNVGICFVRKDGDDKIGIDG